jgi:hypothetical protein
VVGHNGFGSPFLCGSLFDLALKKNQNGVALMNLSVACGGIFGKSMLVCCGVIYFTQGYQRLSKYDGVYFI